MKKNLVHFDHLVEWFFWDLEIAQLKAKQLYNKKYFKAGKWNNFCGGA